MPQGFGRYSSRQLPPTEVLEPEVVLHIAVAPEAGMSERDIIACIDQVAFGYEIVHSPFADWKVAPRTRSPRMDCIRRCCLGNGWMSWPTEGHGLKSCGCSTSPSGIATVRNITASVSNVLGSPLNALRTIVERRCQGTRPGRQSVPGEIVTTGTLT